MSHRAEQSQIIYNYDYYDRKLIITSLLCFITMDYVLRLTSSRFSVLAEKLHFKHLCYTNNAVLM